MKQLLNSLGLQRQDRTKYENPEYADGWNDIYDRLVASAVPDARGNRSEILQRDFSEEFVKKMKNAVEMSHYKYGWMSKTYPELAQAYKCIGERLEMYLKTLNKEYLVDVANFAMIEFMYPSLAGTHYTPTDSSGSPGLAGGISYKELMEEG